MSDLLPTATESMRLADEGMERAAAAAGDEWLEAAKASVRYVAASGAPFSSNEVWAAGLKNPGNRRALGKVFRLLESKGEIVKTGEQVRSRWGHGQDIAVWRRTRQRGLRERPK